MLYVTGVGGSCAFTAEIVQQNKIRKAMQYLVSMVAAVGVEVIVRQMEANQK